MTARHEPGQLCSRWPSRLQRPQEAPAPRVVRASRQPIGPESYGGASLERARRWVPIQVDGQRAMRSARVVTDEHPLMMRILGHRLTQARLCGKLWARQGLGATLRHLVSANDVTVAADALGSIFGAGMAGRGSEVLPRWPESSDVSWLADLACATSSLLGTRSEEHVRIGVVAAECSAGSLQPLFDAVASSEGLRGSGRLTPDTDQADEDVEDDDDHDEEEAAHAMRRARWAARSAEPHIRELCRALMGAKDVAGGELGRRCGEAAAVLEALVGRAVAGLGATLAGDALRAALRGSDSDDDSEEGEEEDDSGQEEEERGAADAAVFGPEGSARDRDGEGSSTGEVGSEGGGKSQDDDGPSPDDVAAGDAPGRAEAVPGSAASLAAGGSVDVAGRMGSSRTKPSTAPRPGSERTVRRPPTSAGGAGDNG